MKPLNNIANRASFFKKIEILLLIILFFMIGGFFTWSENISITRIIKVASRLGMTVAVLMVHQRIIKEGAISSFQWKNKWSPFLYFGYMALAAISFLWTTDVPYSVLQWIMNMESLVFAFYFMKCLLLLDTYFKDGNIRFANLLGNAVFMLMCIFVVGMQVNPTSFFRVVEGGDDIRLGGYIMNPNELGMICGVGISCLIFDLYHSKKRFRTLFKILLLVLVLVLTKSRSSLVGLLLIIFFHLRKSNSKVLKFAIYAGIAAVVPIAIEKVILRKEGIDDILSMTGRMPFWKALITEGLPREPLLGFGYMRIDYKDHFESVHTYSAQMTHNTFMQVLMNLGFIGLVLALFQLAFTIRGFLREQAQKKMMLLGILIPILINSFTEFGIFGETNYGILFFQMLIFSISLNVPDRLLPREKLFLKRNRPDLGFEPHKIFEPERQKANKEHKGY